MEWSRIIAEDKIREAIRDGVFDRLPGAGKPLVLDDDSSVPEDLRASYRLLKNAGVLPEEMQLRKDMITLEEMLRYCRDEEERKKLSGELTAKRLRYQSLMNDRGWSSSGAFARYEDKIMERLADDGKSRTHE